MSEDLPQPTNSEQQPQPVSQWQYNPQDTSPSSVDIADTGQPDGAPAKHTDAVSWTASEFIAHHKDVRWYISVAGVTIVLAALVRLLTRDNISTAMVLIIGTFFCIMAARKPRVLAYTVNDEGILIGQQFYPYTDFRSFSVMHDGPFANVELAPLKRFMPMTSIYCSPDKEDEAIEMLADFLPYEERTHSTVDRLARRIRF